MMPDSTELILRLCLAALCAGIIGLERERKSWTAGMRTHMMVGLGAALFMIVSSFGFFTALQNEKVVLDPSRVAAQVVSGIGFLGAGTIMFLRKGIVRGLTTASGLWTVAGIGLAIGGGMYTAGIATTVIALVVLWVLQPLEKRLFRNNKLRRLRAKFPTREESAEVISQLLSIKGGEHLLIGLEKRDHDWLLTIRTRQAALLAKSAEIVQKHNASAGLNVEI